MKKILLLAIVAIGLGFWSGTNIFPYLFSSQKPLSDKSLTGEYDFGSDIGEFLGQPVSSFYTPPALAEVPINVLGSTSSNKRIEVDLTNQRLYAYEGDTKAYDFLISSGLWGKTPTGTFRIWTKLRYVKMEGGNKALHTYYNLPNVPFTMFFANDQIPTWRGFGIHGTYWHNNFGHPMSHGCINMKTSEVEKIYYWASPALGDKRSVRASDENPGTEVIIYGKAPRS